MSEDAKIQKITELLEKGGTMLADHHDCGAPMFRYKGQIVCPVCSYEEKEAKNEESLTEDTPVKRTGQMEYSDIAFSLKNKMKDIAASLENETDLQRVREKLECIETGIKLIKMLES